MDAKKLDQETIKILQKLGLTFTQARIYLVLSDLGTSSVKIISKTSGIDRAEIYRKIPSLIKLGLIQKILGIPVKFKAISLKDGLNILLEQESFEHLELQKRTKKLTKKIKEKSKETKQQIENQFNIIPGKK
ncbi:TrmB family transcriptional regulator, partial [Candidatus Bathyarchaeota archaeon]